MSSSMGKARKWLAGVVAGDELPSYEKARAEMGGVPWRKLEHTDSWFLMSANSLEAQDDIDLEAPLDSQPVLDTMPAMPPIMSIPALPAIPAAQPVVLQQPARDTLAVLSVAATAPIPEAPPAVVDFSASLSGEPINLRTPLVSLKTALLGAAVAGFVALVAVVAVHQPPAPMAVPQAVAAPTPKPAAPTVAVAAIDKGAEKKAQQPEPHIRPTVKHPARRAHRH